MGDMARSVSSSLGSRRQGNRAMVSPRVLSGDDAWTMLSEASSSSLSILEVEDTTDTVNVEAIKTRCMRRRAPKMVLANAFLLLNHEILSLNAPLEKSHNHVWDLVNLAGQRKLNACVLIMKWLDRERFHFIILGMTRIAKMVHNNVHPA